MNKIQLIDLDTLSEEETGGIVISRQEMRSRLGWLSTEVEPQLKQELETTEIVEEAHKEAQTQATQEHQPSHALASTDTLEAADIVKGEYVEENKEQKDVVEK